MTSLGRGIGQQTGSESPFGDALEAQRILKVIANVELDLIEDQCGAKASKFILDMRRSLVFGLQSFRVTGKQVFVLRSIKDQLIEKGII